MHINILMSTLSFNIDYTFIREFSTVIFNYIQVQPKLNSKINKQ
jgi:hypothetical protein